MPITTGFCSAKARSGQLDSTGKNMLSKAAPSLPSAPQQMIGPFKIDFPFGSTADPAIRIMAATFSSIEWSRVWVDGRVTERQRKTAGGSRNPMPTRVYPQ